jgi:hypothetical protein
MRSQATSVCGLKPLVCFFWGGGALAWPKQRSGVAEKKIEKKNEARVAEVGADERRKSWQAAV